LLPTATLTDANDIWLEEVLLKPKKRVILFRKSRGSVRCKRLLVLRTDENQNENEMRYDNDITSESVAALSSHIVTRSILSSMVYCALKS
jgi:hypothetical protein